ncbi:hypothetical protein [Sciscionella sediminilitoris]|uniref:hypothetical protein n=1 Tax=Sciscionella sediminilitoris TaxID=1445613 RepID=UPI0012E31A41|nr:hypothetical protein [Sciscionella sp. SE31]
MRDYTEFPDLSELYLEDSSVLDAHEEPGSLSFKVDAVLTPENLRYSPKPGE